MRKFFEFVISDDEFERRVMRFYPKTTHVHGFGDEPPKTWDEVYKTYLSFAVLYFDKEYKKATVEYSARWDECSGLNELVNWIENKEKFDEPFMHLRVFGDATQWIIIPFGPDRVVFTLYPIYQGSGCTFFLDNEQLSEFAEVINTYLEHSLKHSQGI